MSAWSLSEVPTVAKMNQKTVFIGSTAPTTTFAGQIWVDDSVAGEITVNVRNPANTAWIKISKTAVTPTTQAFGDAAAVGTSTENARADHKHGMPDSPTISYGSKVDLDLSAGTDGVATTVSRSDHKHALPNIIKEIWIPASVFALFAGATFVEASTTAGQGGMVAVVNAAGQRIKTQVRIPTGVTGISAITLWVATDTNINTIEVYARAVTPDATEIMTTGGVADSANFTYQFSGGTNWLLGKINVITAFDAAGLIVADDLLQIELRYNAGGQLRIVGIYIRWS